MNSNFAASDVHTFYLNIVHTKKKRGSKRGRERESGEREEDREGGAIGTLSSSFDGCRCHTSYFNGRVLLPIWLIEQAGRQADRHLLLHATKLVAICLTCIVWVHSEISIELQNLLRPPSPRLPRKCNSNRNSRFIARIGKLSAVNLAGKKEDEHTL